MRCVERVRGGYLALSWLCQCVALLFLEAIHEGHKEFLLQGVSGDVIEGDVEDV
jgi:hypothetical protein